MYIFYYNYRVNMVESEYIMQIGDKADVMQEILRASKCKINILELILYFNNIKHLEISFSIRIEDISNIEDADIHI